MRFDEDKEALRQRVKELETSLREARQTAAVERARADAATQSQHRAWSLGSWTQRESGRRD